MKVLSYSAIFAVGLCVAGTFFVKTNASIKSHLVAFYPMNERAGNIVHDTIGNYNGQIIGRVIWTTKQTKGLTFDGEDIVRIPHLPVVQSGCCVSISVWIHGRGSDFHLNRWRGFQYTPDFQVAGDKIYMVSSSARLLPHHGDELYTQLWTGTSDISGSRWSEIPRTFGLTREAIEPKLQIVGNTAQYEYFGKDTNNVWQLWTATANANGSEWKIYQRSHQKQGYTVEQDYVIQVVGDRVYYFWPRKDTAGIWQMWTASSRTDGSGFIETQRSWRMSKKEAAVSPLYFQVVGDRIFYLYGNWFGDSPQNVYLAISNTDGSNWHVLRTMPNTLPGAAFAVNGGTVYLAYTHLNGRRAPRFYLARMNENGSKFRAAEEKLPGGFIPFNARIQPVGDWMHYAINATSKITSGNIDATHATIWTARSKLDGSFWKTWQHSTYPPYTVFNYKPVEVVGSKVYYSVERIVEWKKYTYEGSSAVRLDTSLAEEGSNVISQGDAFGIGVTADRSAQAFVNAGQDYLYRAEAPTQIAGAVATASIDGAWHHLVMTYDQKRLKLYMDGHLAASEPYNTPIGENPFPFLIGDGFHGEIRNLSIYDAALNAEEIKTTL